MVWVPFHGRHLLVNVFLILIGVQNRKDENEKRNYVFFVSKTKIISSSWSISYNVIPRWAQLLNVSSTAFKGDIDGLIVKDIMEDIKERGQIRFGSRLILTVCRYGTNGKMNFTCEEDTLRFDPDSQRNATLSAISVPTCHYVR